MSGAPKFFFQDIKNKGNLYMAAIDKKFSPIYRRCDNSAVDLAVDCINIIEDDLDKNWEAFKQTFNKYEKDNSADNS